MPTDIEIDERKRRLWQTRRDFIGTMLPEEMRRDALTSAVANAYCQKEDFAVEGFLLELARVQIRDRRKLEQHVSRMLAAQMPRADGIAP